MGAGQVLLALHLDQTADGTPELKTQPVALVELGRRPGGRDDELHALVVEGIDQRDQPPRRVLLRLAQGRDLGQENGMEFLGQLGVVGSAARALAESGEAEPADITSASNSRPSSMASAMSITCSSSMHHRLARRAMRRATSCSGSCCLGVEARAAWT